MKSMVASVEISAVVRMLPIRPCASMGMPPGAGVLSDSAFGRRSRVSAIVGESWIERHAAVDEKRSADSVAAAVRGEPDGGAADVLALADAPVRHEFEQLVQRFGCVPGALVDRRADRARR